MANYLALPANGHTATWTTWTGEAASQVRLRWENEGWTAEIELSADRAVAVLRMSATWMVQQMLLFRDMEEPDLWLATDGRGRWGEVNGAHRTDLDGVVNVDFAGTPFTNSILIHRTPLHVGHSTDLHVLVIDVETLSVQKTAQRYTRVDEHRWEYESLLQQHVVTVEVDEFGFVIDEPDAFRRADTTSR